MATFRQIKANRENALKSTGPVTDEGKERSSRNAVTHGLTARLAAMPADRAIAQTRAEHWHVSLRPMTNFDNYLVEQVTMASVRIDRCQVHEEALRQRANARAAMFWDDDRALAAEALAADLAARPAAVRLALRRTPQGCAWLLARWALLIKVLRGGGAWTAPQTALALDLLGTAAELRAGGSPLDAPADPLAVAEAEADSLRETSGRLAPLDAEDRAQASYNKPAEPDPMLNLVRRYEAAASRQLRWALKALRASQPMYTARVPAFRPDPALPWVSREVDAEAPEPPAQNEPGGALGETDADEGDTGAVPPPKPGRGGSRPRG